MQFFVVKSPLILKNTRQWMQSNCRKYDLVDVFRCFFRKKRTILIIGVWCQNRGNVFQIRRTLWKIDSWLNFATFSCQLRAWKQKNTQLKENVVKICQNSSFDSVLLILKTFLTTCQEKSMLNHEPLLLDSPVQIKKIFKNDFFWKLF